MGSVKEYYMPDVDDYNNEYFFHLEDEYYEALDIMDEIERDRFENEYNAIELHNALTTIQECAANLGITCDTAVAALTDFIERYENAICSIGGFDD